MTSVPPFDGGASVLDYTVSYDNGGMTFTILSSGLNQLTYIATQLTPGLTYSFKVQARNILGLSDYSSVISILAAQIPDAPT